MKNPWVIIGIIALILVVGSVIYSKNISSSYNEGVDASVVHIKGNPDASVVLTEYSDFQCPACASFHPVIVDVMNQFGDEIRFEYKHFPLPMHNLAEAASRASEAAGQQDAFFEYHDILFERQRVWSSSPNPRALFIEYADELGLDVQTFRRHMNSSVLTDKIRAEHREGRDLNVTGTPTMFLNGERMIIQTYDDFYEQIVKAVNPDIQFSLPEVESKN